MLFLCDVADWYWCDRCSSRAHDLDHVWTVVQEQKVCEATILYSYFFQKFQVAGETRRNSDCARVHAFTLIRSQSSHFVK